MNALSSKFAESLFGYRKEKTSRENFGEEESAFIAGEKLASLSGQTVYQCDPCSRNRIAVWVDDYAGNLPCQPLRGHHLNSNKEGQNAGNESDRNLLLIAQVFSRVPEISENGAKERESIGYIVLRQ